MKVVSKSLYLLKSKTYSKKSFFLPWRCPKMLFSHSASNSKRAQYRNICVLRWTIWRYYTIREELLDTPEAFEEHEASAGRHPSKFFVWATADLQSTLRAFFKFKSHLNTMATEQHGRDRSTPPKKH